MSNPAGGNYENTASLSGIRILVVEDEYLFAELLEQTFTDAGAEVVGPANSFSEAFELIQLGQFDVAVLDANLRGRSVHPLASAIQRHGKPFVFLSGYSKIPELSTRFPNVPTFEKPTSLETLQGTLVGLLRNGMPA